MGTDPNENDFVEETKQPEFVRNKYTKRSKHLEAKIKCKFCDQYFGRQGLGGHMSRVHPGKSNDYRSKRIKREEREDKRRLLRLSQQVYRYKFSVPEIK